MRRVSAVVHQTSLASLAPTPSSASFFVRSTDVNGLFVCVLLLMPGVTVSLSLQKGTGFSASLSTLFLVLKTQ